MKEIREMQKTANIPDPMQYSSITRLSHIVVISALALLICSDVAAQGRFQLRRTQVEGIPINVSIIAGYNGLNEVADLIQDAFDHTVLTTHGGVMLGLRGTIRIDTMFLPIWVGAESYYHRMSKRWTKDKPEVRWPDEEGRVDAVETMGAYGGNVLFVFGPVSGIAVVLGAGLQYLDSVIDIGEGPLGGFGSHYVGTAVAGLDFILLSYEHGSIDLQFRGMKGFGRYGSFHVQSLLGFTFSFR
jgi:hypothetical protein